MIESGSEMYRVEDTMNRIAYNAGIQKSVVFTTPTGLFIGIENQLMCNWNQLQCVRLT